MILFLFARHFPTILHESTIPRVIPGSAWSATSERSVAGLPSPHSSMRCIDQHSRDMGSVPGTTLRLSGVCVILMELP